jgi:hypothetical protein
MKGMKDRIEGIQLRPRYPRAQCSNNQKPIKYGLFPF